MECPLCENFAEVVALRQRCEHYRLKARALEGEMKETIDDRNAEAKQMRKKLDKRNREAQKLEARLEDRKQEIRSLTRKLKERDAEVADLREKLQALVALEEKQRRKVHENMAHIQAALLPVLSKK